MPAKPFDINEYVKSLKLSHEDEKAMAAIVAKPEVAEEIKRGWNSQSESSRLVDEANQTRTAAAAEKAEADRIKAEADAAIKANQDWAAALLQYEPANIAVAAERDALTEEKLAYEAYLRDVIGIAPSLVLDGKEPIKPTPVTKEPPVNNQPPAPATLTPEDLKRMGLLTANQVQPAIDLLGNIPFELTALNFEHMELYGKPIPSTELAGLRTEFMNPKNERSLADIAAEKFHFAERRTQLSEQALVARAQTMADEMYKKRMDDLQLPSVAVGEIPANLDSVVHFNSKGFTENSKRPAEGMAGISAEEMGEFLQFDKQLADQNIRPTLGS